MQRLLVPTLLSLALCAPAIAQPVKHGRPIPKVVCQGSTYSYSLYVPKGYQKTKKYPVLFCFAPGGNGHVFVQRAFPACEKHGWIVAGSLDSKNGPLQEAAIDAMHADVKRRLSIDETRIYACGFSGGSRVATWFASRVKGAGNLAIGGVFIGQRPLPKIPYFLTCGETDFNRKEMEMAEQRQKAAGLPVKLRIFPGAHILASKAVFAEGIAWLDNLVKQKQLDELKARLDALEALMTTDPLAAYRGAQELIEQHPKAEGIARARAIVKKLARNPKLNRELRADRALKKLDKQANAKPLTARSAAALIKRYEALARTHTGTKAAVAAVQRATELSKKYP